MKLKVASTLLLLSLAGCHKFKKVPTDEQSCKLVSSRGILFSCDVHPITQASDTGELQFAEFQEGAESVIASATTSLSSLGMAHYPADIAKHHDGVVVYVVTAALPAFVAKVLPGIKKDFKLVTGDSDRSPIEALGIDKFKLLADNEHLLKWFAQNSGDGATHKKIVDMPIGLDYHTLKAGPHPWGPQATPKEQEAMLLGKAKAAPAFAKRVHKGFFIGTHTSPERAAAVSGMDSSPFVEMKSRTPNRGAFWEECGKYRFVMSPLGNGIDCHRTWEALAMGSIPVVSDRLHALYDDNGINVVQLSDAEWGQLDSRAVQKKIKDAEARQQDGVPEFMYLKYWLAKIRD